MSASPESMAKLFDKLAKGWDEAEEIPSSHVRDILTSLPINDGDAVLDIGCGTGVAVPYIYGMCKRPIKAIDLSAKMIEIAKSKFSPAMAQFEVCDFYAHEGKYDFILCYNAYPHFMDVDGFMAKARTLLNDGGHLAIVHSIGREEVSACHKNMSSYSRELLPAEEEAARYSPFFKIENTIDASDEYLILLKKKSKHFSI